MQRSWIKMILGCSTLLFLLASCAVPGVEKAKKTASADRAGASDPLTWEPQRIREPLAAGETKEYTISVTSNVDLADVELTVPDALGDAVTVEPAAIPDVTADEPVELTITIAIPAEGPSSYKGRIQAKSGERKLGNGFQIEIEPPSGDGNG